MEKNNYRPLTREARLAMLRSLRDGCVSDADRDIIDEAINLEPVTIRFVADKEDLEKIQRIKDEVPDLPQ